MTESNAQAFVYKLRKWYPKSQASDMELLDKVQQGFLFVLIAPFIGLLVAFDALFSDLWGNLLLVSMSAISLYCLLFSSKCQAAKDILNAKQKINFD